MNAMLDKGASASDVSDKIKEILFTKSAQRIDASKPDVAATMFGDEVPEEEPETEVASELETEEEPQEEESNETTS